LELVQFSHYLARCRFQQPLSSGVPSQVNHLKLATPSREDLLAFSQTTLVIITSHIELVPLVTDNGIRHARLSHPVAVAVRHPHTACTTPGLP
jgi:hypothetical protein